MPIIRADGGVVAQINVFTVPEGAQQALVEVLADAAGFARQSPGRLSASLHTSHDGTRVVDDARSERPEAARRVIERLRDGCYLDRDKAFGEAHPGLCDVVFTLGS